MGYLLAFLLGGALVAILIHGHADQEPEGTVPPEVAPHLRSIYDEIARMRYRLDLLSPPPNKESIMSMVKHGNTFAPNARVVRVGQTAASGATAGTVLAGAVEDEQGELRVRVRWDDGVTSPEDPASLDNA